MNLLKKLRRLFYLKVGRNYHTINGKKLVRHGVNFEWSFNPDGNIGDIISPYIIDFIVKKRNLVSKKYIFPKHMYCVGSIINFADFDAVIWGSGFVNQEYISSLKTKRYIRYDIRAVRGPLTRKALVSLNYKCPSVYGDPAVFLPLIYHPRLDKKYKVSVIRHYIDNDKPKNPSFHYINILNNNWKEFVNEVIKSELVISSSLHGIIISESYGVPAIWLENSRLDSIKFYDWYLSTGRNGDNYKIDNILKYKKINCDFVPLEKIEFMRNQLLSSFPIDLFKMKGGA